MFIREANYKLISDLSKRILTVHLTFQDVINGAIDILIKRKDRERPIEKVKPRIPALRFVFVLVIEIFYASLAWRKKSHKYRVGNHLLNIGEGQKSID